VLTPKQNRRSDGRVLMLNYADTLLC